MRARGGEDELLGLKAEFRHHLTRGRVIFSFIFDTGGPALTLDHLLIADDDHEQRRLMG